MSEKAVTERARRNERAGKSASTQAGEFVREEFRHIRLGKHGARSAQQGIAIGLSKARRAGVNLPPPKRGPLKIRQQAKRDLKRGRHPERSVSRLRSRAVLGALKREGHGAAAPRAVSRATHEAANRRSASDRSNSSRKAVQTKGQVGLVAAARKAAQTRRRS